MPGAWSTAACVVTPEDGCMFSDLQLPTGATASGHANCHSNANGGVPGGFSCLLSKPEHTCSPATCLEGGTWSAAVCVESENAGCELSELAKPAGSQISVARCETGGTVPSGAVCEFSKPAHVCSGAVCVAGSWSTAHPKNWQPKNNGVHG